MLLQYDRSGFASGMSSEQKSARSSLLLLLVVVGLGFLLCGRRLSLSCEILLTDLQSEVVVTTLQLWVLSCAVGNQERVSIAKSQEAEVTWLEFGKRRVLALELSSILGDFPDTAFDRNLLGLGHERTAAARVRVKELFSVTDPIGVA
jgi:hypothetical protein